jgi:hypothetical protein
VGVIDPIDPQVETAGQIRDTVLEAAAYIEPARLGSCDDCGFTRPCLPVAAVVGCVLSAINEGARIAAGHTGWTTWVQVGLNFMVPFLVSSYGYLTAQTADG